MKIVLKNEVVALNLQVEEEKVLIKSLAFNGQDYLYSEKGVANSYVHLSGGNYRGHFFGGYAKVSELLTYHSHSFLDKNGDKQLIIVEKNENIQVKTIYSILGNISAIEVYKEITNITDFEHVIESAMPICLDGIMSTNDASDKSNGGTKEIDYGSPLFFDNNITSAVPYLWKAYNSWCNECSFEKIDAEKDGMRKFYLRNKTSALSVTSNGSASTYKYLPLGILEKEPYGYLMFEIFNNGCWSYSLQQPTNSNNVAFCVGKNLYENGWFKVLKPNEQFCTEKVRLCGAKTIDGLIKSVSKARKKSLKQNGFYPADYVIYNNFMHNTYDHPTEEIDRKNIEEAKKYGADYFVIDAGWHDDSLEGISPTQKIGEWRENTLSYPSGLKTTLDYIRECGMKPGLWVEVQSIGVYCKNANILPDECFFNIRGKRLIGNRRYQLNFAVEKTREFATRIIDDIVERYMPEYIKIDYNQVQYGTENLSGSLAEGLTQHFSEYLKWFEMIQDKYPKILFESCASGGMNMMPSIAEKTSVFSLSDLSKYNLYPYIIANSPFAVLPEQSGVWNIPVRRVINGNFVPATELKSDDEEVIMNVINSLYMVMHLGSKLEYLTSKQSKLLKEGIDYYRSLAEVKKSAVAIMPNGFTTFGDDVVYVAMKSGKKIYLSIYNLSDEDMSIAKDFSEYKITKAKIAYPSNAKNKVKVWNGVFQCDIKAGTARAFELS